MNLDDNNISEAPDHGWKAIGSALQPLYGDQEPAHYGTIISYLLGGPDPLDGISSYCRSDPKPHFHLVTYGFSELYDKKLSNHDISGYGFELTFRLSRDLSDTKPPMWVLNFLQNLARYVFETGNAFVVGDHMDLNGPISLGTKTDITAIAFMSDPELPSISTPNGSVSFIQVVGLTHDEYVSNLAWNTESFLRVLTDQVPLGLTDIGRLSLLRNTSFSEKVASGISTNGSSTGLLFMDSLKFEIKKRLLRAPIAEVIIGANSILQFATVLPSRLSHGRALKLVSQNFVVSLEPSDKQGWELRESNSLVIKISPKDAAEMCNSLHPVSATVDFPGVDNLKLRVVPSIIRDQKGNVTNTIG